MSRRVATLVLAALLTVGGCDAATESAAGLVIAVKSSGALEVDAFTIRTDAGTEVTFKVGNLDVRRGFPASHLREHMATASPVAVVYRLEDGQRVAILVTDA